jgi:hypothetical protein
VPAEDAIDLPDVDYAPEWQKTSFGYYLSPQRDLSKDGGAVDVIFHFHFGREASAAWRTSRTDAVIVSATFGMASRPYERAMRDPQRFDRMIEEVLLAVAEERHTPPLHVRRLGIVSFSAGFGAVGRILANPSYYERIDALVLLDSIHTAYTRKKRPDPRGIAQYTHFANDAKTGRKVMVVTHSAIVPYGYPSSTQTAGVLLEAIGVPKVETEITTKSGMHQLYRADAGSFHAFGFSGKTKKDHMDHLAMVGDIVREYVARRWAHMAMLEGSEQKRALR